MSSYPGAAPVPPNATVDLENPQDVLWTINLATQGLTLVIVSAFVFLRYYAKVVVTRGGPWGHDDWATLAAYVFMIGYCITGVFASTHGNGGMNQWEVTKQDIVPYFKSCYAATIFYAPMAFTVKLALLVIIARVFGPVHRKTMMGIWVLIGLLAGYYIAAVIVKIRICAPVSAYWHGQTDKCLNQTAIVMVDAIVSVVSDLAILFLPTPLTWSLQMPRKRKLRVIGLLCAGGVATGFSVYRLVMISQEGSSTNQTIVFIKVILTGNAEVGIGLICACLPACSALMLHTGSTNKSRSGYGAMADSAVRPAAQSRAGAAALNGINVDRSIQQTSSAIGDKHGMDVHISATDEWDHADSFQLVSYAQANPKSNPKSSRSETSVSV